MFRYYFKNLLEEPRTWKLVTVSTELLLFTYTSSISDIYRYFAPVKWVTIIKNCIVMLCLSDKGLTATLLPQCIKCFWNCTECFYSNQWEKNFSNLKRKMEPKFYLELTSDTYTKILIKYSLPQFIFTLLPKTLFICNWELII